MPLTDRHDPPVAEGKNMSRGEQGSRAGRHLAELAVIIVGVLLALTADSLWERRQERARELRYLHDLDAELQVADSVLTLVISYDSTRATRSWQAYRVLTSTGPLAEADSSWEDGLGMSYEESPFSIATTASLLQTGDIKLIRAHRLRVQVAELQALIASHAPRLVDLEERLLQNWFDQQHQVRLMQRRGEVDLATRRANIEYGSLIFAVAVSLGLRTQLHGEIRDRVADFRASVSEALAESAPERQ